MPSVLEKLSSFTQNLSTNFFSEIKKNHAISNYIEQCNAKFWNEPGISKIYQGFQFTDFLIHNSTKDYCKSISNPNYINKLIDRIYPISQYYGGVGDTKVPSLWNKFIEPFSKYLDYSWYKDYKVLSKIENQEIPKIFKSLFSTVKFEEVTLESEETLKQLKDYIYNQEEWLEKEIILEDIRKVEVKRIFVKNLRKTIKFDLEFTVILQGIDRGKTKKLKQNFGSSIEFINENGKWIVSNFSYAHLI